MILLCVTILSYNKRVFVAPAEEIMDEQTVPTFDPGFAADITERLWLLTEHIMTLEAIIKDLRLRMASSDVSSELWS